MAEETTTQEPEINSVTDLDDVLAGYNKSLTQETKEVEVKIEQPKIPAPTKTPDFLNRPEGLLTDWQGNPAYYQTGKKAGQLRPSGVKRPATNKDLKDADGNMQISGTLIEGAMFIMLIDMLIPLTITAAHNTFSKKTKIDLEDLQLTEKQKKDLTPISDEVVKYLSLKANPIWLMVITMTGIYGINYMAAIQKR